MRENTVILSPLAWNLSNPMWLCRTAPHRAVGIVSPHAYLSSSELPLYGAEYCSSFVFNFSLFLHLFAQLDLTNIVGF